MLCFALGASWYVSGVYFIIYTGYNYILFKYISRSIFNFRFVRVPTFSSPCPCFVEIISPSCGRERFDASLGRIIGHREYPIGGGGQMKKKRTLKVRRRTHFEIARRHDIGIASNIIIITAVRNTF